MKENYLTTLLLCAITLTACGGGGGGSSDTPQNRDNTTSNIQKYKIKATPTSGGNCRGANGTMIINGSTVSGTIKTGWGDNLVISGTYTSQSGDIDGGFAKNNKRLATYNGNMQNNSGSGNWSDSLGCSGRWKATGLASNTTPTNTTPTNDSKTFDAQNLQGYEINYKAEGLISYKIALACDGSFKITATRHGVDVPIMSGDEIDISDKSMVLNSAVNIDEKRTISLNNGNIVLGESVDEDGNIITEVKKVSSCN